MQLKRDTDYTVRILYCLNQNRVDNDSPVKKGMTLSEIARQTVVPKTVAGRICETLVEKGFICLIEDQAAAEKTYYSTEKLLSYSLWDIVNAVEGTVEFFAVFDKRTEMYKSCEEQFFKVQGKIERVLAGVTLEHLFDMKTAI